MMGRGDATELFVQPAAGDSGTALGAATYVAARTRRHAPADATRVSRPVFTKEECLGALRDIAAPLDWVQLDDAPGEAARCSRTANRWRGSRAEWNSTACARRAQYTGSPSVAGMADLINAQIKFSERWRPFCPSSVLDRVARQIFKRASDAVHDHHVRRGGTLEIAHSRSGAWDGTARVQVVDQATNPRYYMLLEQLGTAYRQRGGVEHVAQWARRTDRVHAGRCTRRCSSPARHPEYLVMEDLLVTKRR